MSYGSPDTFHTLKKMHEKKKKCIYCVWDDGHIAAAGWKSDMERYLVSDKCNLSPLDDLERVYLIFGMVLDIEELPLEMEKEVLEDNQFYLLTKEWYREQDEEDVVELNCFDSLSETIERIESLMEEDDRLSIEDFSIIFGHEMDLGLTVPKTGSAIAENKVYN
jgi:hypothetical protein